MEREASICGKRRIDVYRYPIDEYIYMPDRYICVTPKRRPMYEKTSLHKCTETYAYVGRDLYLYNRFMKRDVCIDGKRSEYLREETCISMTPI